VAAQTRGVDTAMNSWWRPPNCKVGQVTDGRYGVLALYETLTACQACDRICQC
jgi:hypothetical protein